MTLPRLSLCTATVLLALSSLNAQSVTTAPVGAVSVNVNANSDQPVGITLQRAAIFTGKASAVNGTTVTAEGTLPASTSVNYVKFLTGAAAGQWVQISSTSGNSLTLAESAQALGVAIGDQIEIRPFWTLATLFPDGQGFPSTNNPDQPAARLYLYSSASVGVNLSSAANYLYIKGVEGVSNGWYDGDFQSADNAVVNPETYLVINNSSSQSAKVVTIGDVPVKPQANTVVARTAGEQDNLVYNPYPANLTLATAGLISSGAVRPWNLNESTPRDVVFIYSASATGFNPSSSASFYYLQNVSGIPDGWYNDDAESGNAYVLPAGGAFIIRKHAGATTAAEWKPSTPYTL